MLGLEWEDIDLERGDLRVRRQVSCINGEVVKAPLKTRNAYRTLPLAEDTVSVLKEQRRKVGNSLWVFPPPMVGPSPGTACCICSISPSPTSYPSPRPHGQGSIISWLRLSLGNPLTLGLPRGVYLRGCENGVPDAGPLLRRVYTGHLRPYYQRSPATGGEDHGECAGGSDSGDLTVYSVLYRVSLN